MPAVVGRQIYPVRLVVCGDDDATAICDAVFVNVLFIYAQRLRRRGDEIFGVIEVFEAVEFTEVARLVDAKNYRLKVTVEPSHGRSGRYLGEIPRPHGVPDRRKQRVL